MQRAKDVVERSLVKKGFVRDDTHHHYFIYYTLEGKETNIKTHTSHSGKDLNDWLLGQMSKQCNFDKRADFLLLVDCPMGQEEYETLLIAAGKIHVPEEEPEIENAKPSGKSKQSAKKKNAKKPSKSAK